MSKIKSITVTNLRAVSKMSADFNGCTAIITGGNNKGKSSFLKTFPDRLRGIKPSVVLKHGEAEGMAELELTTGEKFIWRFDGVKETLQYISERNIKGSVTKEIATTYFPKVFDVDKFLQSPPREQKKILEKLTGIDFTEFNREYQALYEDRTFKNKLVETERARLIPLEPDLPSVEIDVDDMQRDLENIAVHNQKFANTVKEIASKQERAAEIDDEIIQLQKRIADLTGKRFELEKFIADASAWCDEDENQPKDYNELKADVDAINAKNVLIRRNMEAMKQRERFEKLVWDAEEADKEVKAKENEKMDVIRNSNMPEGFSFSDDGVLYNGYPFEKESLSSSSVYIAALKLAAVGLGEVQTLHFDASFLDKNSLADIEAWANENGLQLLIERPDFEGGEITYELHC